MQSQWAHRKDERWLDSVSVCVCVCVCVCVPLARETERLREKLRERDKERGRKRERERERERGWGKKEREERRVWESTPPPPPPPQRTCHRFAPSCFFIFLRAKTNHFPANRVTVRQSVLAITCMRKGDYHGAITAADLALRIACALPPPFLLFLYWERKEVSQRREWKRKR